MEKETLRQARAGSGSRRGAYALWAAVAFLVSGCAATPKLATPKDCDTRAGYERGVRDGTEGRPSDGAYARLCANSVGALQAYRQGYQSGKDRLVGPAKIPPLRQALPAEVKAPSWVCEVESSSKVFTGVGFSEVEATRAAQNTCSAHFQARSCERAECKVAN